MSHENTVNVLTMNNEPFQQPNGTSSSTDQKQVSKLILRSALQKANVAVQCDSNNDVVGAIQAYQEAILLLERVLATVEKENDRQRLLSIHDSYSERIRLLSSITSKVEPAEETIDIQHRSLKPQLTTIRKITSNSSIESNLRSPVSLNSHWQDPFAKQPVIHMQVSKSTPIRKQSIDHTHDDDDELESDMDIQPDIPPVPAMKPPPRNSSRLTAKPLHPQQRRRSSVSSDDSILSSEDSIVEQPAMVLPSLKSEEPTPVPRIKTAFRARTSSLPRPPLMQRSSSMSTVEVTSPVSDSEKSLPSFDDVDPSSQPYPPQMFMNRPIVSRPSVGGLGSMRRKANRLSIEFRHKEKTNGYGFLIKEDELEGEAYSDTTSQLKLLFALERSMLEGAHITQKLYIPKNLWQQPNIRLSSMDIKMTACESLMNDMARLEQWTYLDDLTSSARLLDHFETSVDHMQMNLSKKLKRESTSAESNTTTKENQRQNNTVHHSHSRDSMSAIGRDNKKTQSFMSWGTKLTKSVEKMNAFSLTKTEDQYKNYIDTLQRFLTKIHVLEHWLNHYHAEKLKSRQPQHDVLIIKLNKICTVINNVIGGFIIKDITVLLAKWLKRGGSWVNE